MLLEFRSQSYLAGTRQACLSGAELTKEKQRELQNVPTVGDMVSFTLDRGLGK